MELANLELDVLYEHKYNASFIPLREEWSCGTVVKSLLFKHEVLGSIPNTIKKHVCVCVYVRTFLKEKERHYNKTLIVHCPLSKSLIFIVKSRPHCCDQDPDSISRNYVHRLL